MNKETSDLNIEIVVERDEVWVRIRTEVTVELEDPELRVSVWHDGVQIQLGGAYVVISHEKWDKLTAIVAEAKTKTRAADNKTS